MRHWKVGERDTCRAQPVPLFLARSRTNGAAGAVTLMLGKQLASLEVMVLLMHRRELAVPSPHLVVVISSSLR